MSFENLKQHLRDVAFTTPAPFSEDGAEVLHDEIATNTEAILDAGGKTLIPCGNTGEYYSLSREERVNFVKTTVDTVGSDGVVIAGVAGSTSDAIDLIERYETVGADGVMVHDLDHTYIHRKGLIKYYKRLASATDIGIVLYKRGPELSLPAISELSTVDNIIGLKFAVNDLIAFSETVRGVKGDIVISAGNAERFAPAFALEGAEGFTTGIGAFAPEVSLALQNALEQEDWDRALTIRDLARPYENLRDEPGLDNDISTANNVPAIKYGLELAGRYGGPVRDPIVPLSEGDKRRAEQYFEKLAEFEVTPESGA